MTCQSVYRWTLHIHEFKDVLESNIKCYISWISLVLSDETILQTRQVPQQGNLLELRYLQEYVFGVRRQSIYPL